MNLVRAKCGPNPVPFHCHLERSEGSEILMQGESGCAAVIRRLDDRAGGNDKGKFCSPRTIMKMPCPLDGFTGVGTWYPELNTIALEVIQVFIVIPNAVRNLTSLTTNGLVLWQDF